ncbi:hypothetical protein BJ987_005382 [Nocardia goodfellowii]|uniref:Uncharacterized protein n=1 Tax=Nocardia goodfellowii TaxID=882446 RepID=A0ABS4QL99_9NOCA|nr:hypothetical protein [Nocardia goodfellowii]
MPRSYECRRGRIAASQAKGGNATREPSGSLTERHLKCNVSVSSRVHRTLPAAAQGPHRCTGHAPAVTTLSADQALLDTSAVPEPVGLPPARRSWERAGLIALLIAPCSAGVDFRNPEHHPRAGGPVVTAFRPCQRFTRHRTGTGPLGRGRGGTRSAWAASGEINLANGRQRVSLHACVGRVVTVWANPRSLHISLGGHLIRTVASRLLPEHLQLLRMRGGHPTKRSAALQCVGVTVCGPRPAGLAVLLLCGRRTGSIQQTLSGSSACWKPLAQPVWTADQCAQRGITGCCPAASALPCKRDGRRSQLAGRAERGWRT